MKTLAKILIAQICCLSLLVTDAMAFGGGGKRGEKRGGASRPTVHRSASKSSGKRNPITHSKVSRPTSKPAKRPVSKPASRPQSKPASRPQSKPATKPSAKPSNRPAQKPQRPETRPATKPGHVTYPKPDKPAGRPGGGNNNRPGANRPGGGNNNRPGANRPGGGDNNRPGANRPGGGNNNRPGANRPGGGNNNRPGANRPDRPKEVRPGKNTRPVRRPDFDRKEVNNKKTNNWWNSNKKVTNNRYRKDVNVRNVNREVTINNNFKKNVNWSTNRNNWGYNPWWNRPATRPWYGGSWNCGWNNRYYNHHRHYYYGGYRPLPGYVVYDDDNDWAKAIGWGLVGWGLGSMVYNSGYHTYSNPYPAQPVPTTAGNQVTYSQPITVVASESAPSEERAEEITEQSEGYIVESQEAFRSQDYLKALDLANKAVAEAPGDGALHEYRALVLFALGRFSESAGVLNPVLAGGPGWDWTTMISLYDSQETYTGQLKKLETYAGSKPDAADARFLLGYHYMVCGHIEEANAEFAAAAKLQPADTVSAQLRDLTAVSSNGDDEEEAPPADEEEAPVPEPVPVEQLAGTWVSDKGDQGKVTLALKGDGTFSWTYEKSGKANEFAGDFSMNDNGLLVLDSDESQMVAAVEMPQDNEMKFVLAGGPPGDPGLSFARK
ncbi:MAG: hypothetical protein H7A49_10515 [Akkermansiaceae bacterium]|nr:hypothetical protein [Akkermansiaceae bacterium]MCP5548776.1 hypothetical protein [Akkermansiaceae bacterium]